MGELPESPEEGSGWGSGWRICSGLRKEGYTECRAQGYAVHPRDRAQATEARAETHRVQGGGAVPRGRLGWKRLAFGVILYLTNQPPRRGVVIGHQPLRRGVASYPGHKMALWRQPACLQELKGKQHIL